MGTLDAIAQSLECELHVFVAFDAFGLPQVLAIADQIGSGQVVPSHLRQVVPIERVALLASRPLC